MTADNPHAAPTGDLRPDVIVESVEALLSLDADNALVPHGIGGHARTLFKASLPYLRALASAQPAATRLSGDLMKVAAQLSTERLQGWSNPLVLTIVSAAEWIANKPKAVMEAPDVTLSAQPAAVVRQSVPGSWDQFALERATEACERITAKATPAQVKAMIQVAILDGMSWARPSSAQPAAVAGDALREALAAIVKVRKSIQNDVRSGHSARGAAASDWMREDDRDFRKDLRQLFDNAEAALALVAPQVDAALDRAARNLVPYLKWTIGPESPGHHPTMPSAVAALFDAMKSATPARTFTEAADTKWLGGGAAYSEEMRAEIYRGLAGSENETDKCVVAMLETAMANAEHQRLRAEAAEADMAAARAEAADGARREAAEFIRNAAGVGDDPASPAAAYEHAAQLVEVLIGLPPAADAVASGREGRD